MGCKAKPITLSQLADHYGQRELAPSNRWKSHSTKMGYRGNPAKVDHTAMGKVHLK